MSRPKYGPDGQGHQAGQRKEGGPTISLIQLCRSWEDKDVNNMSIYIIDVHLIAWI